MPAEKKSEYVVIEAEGGAPSLVCAWRDLGDVAAMYLENVDVGVTVALKFTVRAWTDAEYAAYSAARGRG